MSEEGNDDKKKKKTGTKKHEGKHVMISKDSSY